MLDTHRETDYLREEVVFLCNLIQHLVSLDGRTDISLQHLRHAQYEQ